MPEENTPKELSALELCGGFEAYQDYLYNAIITKLKDMPAGDIPELEKCVSIGINDYGLEDGLFSLLRDKRYICDELAHRLEVALNFSRLPRNLKVPEEQIPYWDKKMKDDMAIIPGSTQEQRRQSYLLLSALEEAIEIADEKVNAVA